MPVLRRCVERGDVTVLVTRCTRPDRPTHGGCLLLLTEHRLVVTQETWVMHRLRLHLNAELRHLSNVTWNPDPKLSSLELAATAIDGVRERFIIRAHHPTQVRHLDALLSHAFRTKMATRQVRYSPGAAAVPGSLGDSAGRPFGPAIAI